MPQGDGENEFAALRFTGLDSNRYSVYMFHVKQLLKAAREIKAMRLVFYALYYAVSFTLLLRFRYRFL